MAEESEATVTLTIDGHEVTVRRGTTLLQAAEQLGTDVPHYCYHPGLSSPAMCRLCLVEVEGAPKLMPSCVTAAQDGQVVHTTGEKALGMRRGVLEFYLANHPLDCPICDQSGECHLQDHVHEEGRRHGRSREPKRVLGRDDFGADVLFYGDRCVMCTRCVRFMSEVEQDERITVVERGGRAVIDAFFEEGLEGTHFSGNIVDICPVGALVSKDFLHKHRAWDLQHTPSVCPNCSQGCNVELHTRDNKVQRLKPRTNLEVNGFWMCDYGRLNYEWMNRGERLDAPLVGRGNGTRATAWREALVPLIERLRQLDEGAADVRAVVSPFASNESLGAMRSLMDHVGGGSAVYRMNRAPDEVTLPGFPTLVRRPDLAPNSSGADLLGMERVGDDDGAGGLQDVAAHDGVILVLGDQLVDQPAEFGAEASLYVYFGQVASPAAERADFVLPITSFAEEEGTFTNAQGRVQRYWTALRAPGLARPAWLLLRALLAELTGEPATTTAASAFEHLGVVHDAFSGLTYERIGSAGALLREPTPAGGSG